MGWRRALVLAAASLAVSCSAPDRGGSARPEAQHHPEARFLVDYGGRSYRVDVRFVDIISESVIAVREGAGDGAERHRMAVEPSVTPPGGDVPFADDAYRAVAVDIADAIQGRPPICADGQRMRLALNDEAEARTLYRDNRRAWVVFGFCPPPGGTG